MATATISLHDFLAAAEVSQERMEFVDGRIVSMGGASLAHNQIVHNLNGILYTQLRGRPVQRRVAGDVRKGGSR
jgi:hypothetical protein